MRVRTDENAVVQQQQQQQLGIPGKTFGQNNNAVTATANANENAVIAVPARPLGGKLMGGLRGGARRAALGDISNAPQAKTTTTIKIVETTLQQQQQLQERQPLVPIHHHQPQQDVYPPHHHPIDEDDDLDDDAEVIVIDTPEKPYESLEDQFAEVDDEFHDSRSTMDIDSEDDDETEPDDTEILSISRTSCIPTSTKLDREELRIVRNNFAEEYDPWDTSMVPEYAEDIFRYMRELEVSDIPFGSYDSD
jgi:G2/mitotic-specific cyclin 2